jgi:pyrroloquinoline-quinone synthase
VNRDFLAAIDQLIQSKHLLKHEFYQAWSQGNLPASCLKEYAKEYYSHVKAFPTYLSAIHAHAGDDEEARQILLHNLVEEEGGNPNHPALWKRFASALGIVEEDFNTSLSAIQTVIDTFRNLCRYHPLAEGIAALYAYESQIPEICISKIRGLQEHYAESFKLTPDDWAYFSIHIDADQEHAAQERHLLKRLVNQTNAEAVLSSVNQVLDALWNFLTNLYARYPSSASLLDSFGHLPSA